MDNLFAVFDCPNCGKILMDEITHGENIDTEKDEIIPMIACMKCGSTMVSRRMSTNFQTGEKYPAFEEVDENRAFLFFDLQDEDYEEEPDFYPCDNCDLPDACEDFGCAIKQGIKEDPSW